MKREFDCDSFGSMCPENWEEIVDYLNDKLAGDEDKDDMEEIWENYCNEKYPDAPKPIF